MTEFFAENSQLKFATHEVEKLSGPLTGSGGLQQEVGVLCREETVNLKHKCITILQSRERLLSLPCTPHRHIRNLSQMHVFLFRFRSTVLFWLKDDFNFNAFSFLDALLAITLTSHSELQLKKRTQATTKSYDSLSRWNSPLLYPWHLEFQTSVAEPLRPYSFELGREKGYKINGTPLSVISDRESNICVCVYVQVSLRVRILQSGACSNSLGSITTPFLPLTSTSLEFLYKAWLKVRGHSCIKSPHRQA